MWSVEAGDHERAIPVEISECLVDYGDQGIGPFSLTVDWGEAVAVVGPSGSGKTTLFRLLRGEVRPARGWAEVCGKQASRLTARKRNQFLRKHVSGVDQHPLLLPELDVLDNVALPLRLDGVPVDAAKSQAEFVLDELGLVELAGRDLEMLSGGQAQRVAVARALVRPTGVVLADEPTASLDRANAHQVAELLIGQVRSNSGRSLLLATHDLAVAEMCDRVVDLAHNGPRGPVSGVR